MRNVMPRVFGFRSAVAPRWIALTLAFGCVGAPQQHWIKAGVTTKDEIVEQYGEPDLVIDSESGETAIYRPRDASRPASRVDIPTAQAGPFGTVTATTQRVDPGLGAKPANGGLRGGLKQQLRLRYDTRGIVQDVHLE